MIVQFTASTKDDENQIQEWLAADPSKIEGLSPEFWFTGQGTLTFRVDLNTIPQMYVRLDKSLTGPVARLHTLFSNVSSRKEIASTLIQGFPQLMIQLAKQGVKQIVYQSQSEDLIGFMTKNFGFARIEGTKDHLLIFN